MQDAYPMPDAGKVGETVMGLDKARLALLPPAPAQVRMPQRAFTQQFRSARLHQLFFWSAYATHKENKQASRHKLLKQAGASCAVCCMGCVYARLWQQ